MTSSKSSGNWEKKNEDKKRLHHDQGFNFSSYSFGCSADLCFLGWGEEMEVDMENILEIENLRKEYDEFVLDSIDWKIPRGYITGLIGPNGAGKTTTIKLIMNLIESDGGQVKIFGMDFNLGHIAGLQPRLNIGDRFLG